MSNLTFDHQLLKEHTPEPLEGHTVVVFERVGQAGEAFHSVLVPGSPPARLGFALFGKRPAYFAYAVSTAPERHLGFSESVCLADHVSEFRVVFNLSYAVSDARALAQERNADPLRRVRDQVRRVIRQEIEELPWQAVWEAFPPYARDVVNGRIEELRSFAAVYGIAINSIRLTVRFSEEESRRSENNNEDERIISRLERRSSKPEPEPVLLGGAAPRRVRPGDVILAQFAAYVERFEEQARRVLEGEAASGDIRLGQKTVGRWAIGARVTVLCTAHGLIVPTPTQSCVWDGDCSTLSFDIEVPTDAPPRSTVIVMEAFVHDAADATDTVPVGRLRMALEVSDTHDDEPLQRVKGEAARTAFASYALEDRISVLERVSSIRRSTGMEVFVDVVSLRTGDDWERELSRHIAASDRFLLFWSEYAVGKPWVTWEWQQALDVKGEDALELHLLRHTPVESIPERLRKFHFDDVYLRAIDAERYRREHTPPAPDR